MKLTIGIKALNEERHIERALQSALAAAERFGGEVILADSGSTDDTLQIAARYPVKIVQFSDLSDRSCGAGAQLAFQHAQGEFFYILDGDMELHSAFLEAAIPFMERNPRIAGVGGRIEEVNAANHEFRVRRQALQSDSAFYPARIDRLDCGGLYRSSAVREVGYFADRNLHAFEEFELAARLASRGWELTRLDMPAVRHFGHTIASYALLRKRIRSKHTNAAGEVLRGALGRAHLGRVVSRLSQIRNGALIMIWWLLIAAALIAGSFRAGWLIVAVMALVAPIAFLWFRRGTLAGAAYSFVAWNLTAFGLLAGLASKRKPPLAPISAVVVKAPPPAAWALSAAASCRSADSLG
ncbi:glycosyltransferase family 2 protein [Bosea sp. TAF32]|uniref:glycosyltransferase family 2 protein n=1 Tax=Bosea sp. TAF32 TaxID=3237482 RepID=UPI003F901623